MQKITRTEIHFGAPGKDRGRFGISSFAVDRICFRHLSKMVREIGLRTQLGNTVSSFITPSREGPRSSSIHLADPMSAKSISLSLSLSLSLGPHFWSHASCRKDCCWMNEECVAIAWAKA